MGTIERLPDTPISTLGGIGKDMGLFGDIVLAGIALFILAVALSFGMTILDSISDSLFSRKHRKWQRQHPELVSESAKYAQEMLQNPQWRP